VKWLPTLSLPAGELARRTFNKSIEDEVLDLAAQLSHYFFFAFPAILMLLAIASFFPLHHVTDDMRLAATLDAIEERVQTFVQQQRTTLAGPRPRPGSMQPSMGSATALSRILAGVATLRRVATVLRANAPSRPVVRYVLALMTALAVVRAPGDLPKR
jgi:uncharacterized BrkB/YihY/UPF0761 family membrane protein